MGEVKPGNAGLRGLQKGLRLFGRGAKNALEVMREGRLAAPYRAPHDVVLEERTFRLRRYRMPDGVTPMKSALLLVPPLMVSSEIYDISPELSGVGFLSGHGLDVWLVDFGAPEREDGGLDRTLDDHVLAVDRAISHVQSTTGADVHLLGYSQGGMFVYQAAAYRQSRGLKSLITLGSPVDVWRNLPVKIHTDITEKLVDMAKSAVTRPLSELEGLPGTLTSSAFKLLSAKKELKQLVGMLGLLPDKESLARVANDPKRRFLGGEGFVAWPGPAFREFVDQMVVHNRMASGGFVIAGRSVALSDITCPVFVVVGERDDIAFPAAVRAIRKAAPRATIYELPVQAGHFGLVVGSRAMNEIWPSVIDFCSFTAEGGERPPRLLDASPVKRAEEPREPVNEDLEEMELALREIEAGGVKGLYDLATSAVDTLWRGLGEASLEVSEIIDNLRWQLPRMARIKRLGNDEQISLGKALAEQAEAIPDKPFFLWEGRVFSYGEADARVNQVLFALRAAGVKPGQNVGLLMDNRPDYLTVVTAVNRMGGISVLFNAGVRGRSLDQAILAGDVAVIVADGAHAAEAHAALPGHVLLLGPAEGSSIPAGVTDLETLIDEKNVAPPQDLVPNPGRSADTAFLMFTSGTTGLPKAARITNRRWALAALGSAAACKITTRDTVYCALPLHHATGLLVAVGGALVGGARLALAPRFSTSAFWDDVRRYGATIVFYAGEICRHLVNAPPQPNEERHPVRLFAGNGMRKEVWERLLSRFGRLQVLEFYSSTEGNVALVNFTGEKIGSVGRPLTPAEDLALVEYDVDRGEYVREDDGRMHRVATGMPGALLARISRDHPLSHFDGYLDERENERKIFRDVLEGGDAWFATGDLLKRDEDGDYWFVDRLGDTFRWKGENVSTEQVAQIVSDLPFVDGCVVYGVSLPGREGRAGMAAILLRHGTAFDGRTMFAAMERDLFPAARPRFVRVVRELAMTSSYKYVKAPLAQAGADPSKVSDPLYVLDEAGRTYAPLDADGYREVLR
jgi:putative long chain acyl-CoA synthase